jgi:hypothetical protein
MGWNTAFSHGLKLAAGGRMKKQPQTASGDSANLNRKRWCGRRASGGAQVALVMGAKIWGRNRRWPGARGFRLAKFH